MSPSRAWTFTERGTPDQVLRLSEQDIPTLPPPLPLPKDAPKPEEWVLVKVAYVGLNPAGLFQMGLVPKCMRVAPCTPETDLSGTVLDVWSPEGEKPRFAKGDEVAVFLPVKHMFATGTGALSSHVRIPAKYAVMKPKNVSFRDAAGVPMTACTAWRQLEDAKVSRGHRVLVNSASGGIGSLAVQMARHLVGEDGHVVGVCSGRNVGLVKSLGADEVIDYTRYNRLSAELEARFGSRPFDAVIDCVGIQDVYVHCAKYLKPGGVYSATGLRPPDFQLRNFLRSVFLMILNSVWPKSRWLGGTGRDWKVVSMMDPGIALMEKIEGFLSDGTIRLTVDSVWAFEDVLEGYKVLQGQHARGKIMAKVDEAVD